MPRDETSPMVPPVAPMRDAPPPLLSECQPILNQLLGLAVLTNPGLPAVPPAPDATALPPPADPPAASIAYEGKPVPPTLPADPPGPEMPDGALDEAEKKPPSPGEPLDKPPVPTAE